ncbi:hypothetical protein KIN20_024543 [Parelaphostrongylus tenuis]|uniref:Uncharacterized protein n=1 Tax=Parelaphostrongylus tenuis TaxID=148309 RepID=A0AAD5MYE6_PARTN|nr:hypothetical protein KIN20_024543 [Parelaphostrongylus tenuis]
MYVINHEEVVEPSTAKIFKKKPYHPCLEIEDDPIEDYELLVEGLKSCVDLASVGQPRGADRISSTTKELLVKRRKLELDRNATHLAWLISNNSCKRALREDLHWCRQKKLLDAAKKDLA